MKLPSPFGIGMAAAVALIAGLVIYLNVTGEPPSPVLSAAVPSAIPVPSVAGKEGELRIVTNPPRAMEGRRARDAKSMEEFSSNPKREPEEQAVLDISGERGVADIGKVERLLSMIPTLPPDAQTLAMENATALIPDKDYLNFRERLMKLATSPEMRVAIMDDSLTRGEELRLPNLLELMRTSINDEEKQEIREIFEAYLDKDYGDNPASWEVPLREWVAEHAES